MPGSAPSAGRVESASCSSGRTSRPSGRRPRPRAALERLAQLAEDEHARPRRARPSRVALRVEPGGLQRPLEVVEHRHDSSRASSALPRAGAAWPRAPSACGSSRSPPGSASRARGTRPARAGRRRAGRRGRARPRSAASSSRAGRRWRRGVGSAAASGPPAAPTGPAGRRSPSSIVLIRLTCRSPSSTTSASTTSSSSSAPPSAPAPSAGGRCLLPAAACVDLLGDLVESPLSAPRSSR